jgi:ParB-like chromosome segregation protein Spo0J
MKKFSGNVRDIAGLNDDELRASLKAAGWNKLLPAIKDEHGEVLVGHRRLKIAAEENIDPVIEVHTFGSGPDADNDRMQLAIVSNTGAAPLTAQDRKRHAERMYSGGMTMETVGRVLGVSQKTISLDLANYTQGINQKPTKTASNPKGAGRPKGKPKTRAERAPKAIEREEKVAVLMDAGLPAAKIAERVGLGVRAVNQAMEHVQIKREAEAEIDPSTLSITAQEKLATAIRQHQRKLDAAFEQRVLEECRRRMDEITLPHWKKQIDQAKKLYANRSALMSKELFNIIRRGLHPDSRNSISEKKLAEAFDAFMGLEKFLLNEKDSPTHFGDLPTNLAEWDKMRAKRPAKRDGAFAVRRRG